MMDFDGLMLTLWAVVDDVPVVVENLARHLPARRKAGRAEAVRCRASTKTGAQ